jgi:hypothetical protein
LTLILQVLAIFLLQNPTGIFVALFCLLGLFTKIMMMNISFRIVLKGEAGHVFWQLPEILTFLKFVGVFLISFLMVGVITTPLYIGAALFSVNSFPELSPITKVGFSFAQVAVYLSYLYLIGRFILIFPATAIGEKLTFKQAVKLSKGNGWRLSMILFIPTLMNLIIGISMLSLPQNILFILTIPAVIFGMIMTLIWTTGISIAYKNLNFHGEHNKQSC